MSIAARIESINNNLKNAYKSLDGLGIDLTNTDKNLENLSSKIDILYNELPKVTGEGTEITLTPTRKGRMQLDLKGNTEQKQLSGKNKINTFAQKSTVIQGITVSVDEDGIVTLNGTCTRNNTGVDLNQIIQGDGKKYTLKAEIVDGTYSKPSSDLRFNFHILSSGYNYEGLSQQFGEANSVNKTLIAGHEYDVIGFRVDLGIVLNNLRVKVQLEEGDIATEYEPYCGGQPSPNPDYPQDIHVVTGDNTIRVQGKNLWDVLDYSNITISLNGNPQNVIKGNNTISFTSNKNNNYSGIYIVQNVYSNHIANYDSNKTYTVSFDIEVNNDTTIQFGLDVPKATIPITKGKQRISTTSTASTSALNIYNRYANEVNFIISNIQIEEGSTATDYIPYYHADYPINLGSIELCKIGDYQDMLFKNVVGDENYNVELEDGTWYKKKTIEKLLINGGFQDAGVSDVFYTSKITNYAINNNIPYCKYFKGINNVAGAGGMGNADINTMAFINVSGSTTPRCYIKANKTQSELNTFLAENTPYLYYLLKIPTYIEITDETLISQLDVIKKAKSNEDQTNITQTNENLPFIINATALLKND